MMADMKWVVRDLGDEVHVHPSEGREHERDCWCDPEIEEATADSRRMVVHRLMN